MNSCAFLVKVTFLSDLHEGNSRASAEATECKRKKKSKQDRDALHTAVDAMSKVADILDKPWALPFKGLGLR